MGCFGWWMEVKGGEELQMNKGHGSTSSLPSALLGKGVEVSQAGPMSL